MSDRNTTMDINIIAQLADLKEVDYKNILVLTSLLELLIEKNIISRDEIIQKANEVETNLDGNLP